MRTSVRRAALFATALFSLAGCDQPAAPTALPFVPQAPFVLEGQITALALQPGNGATVIADHCEEAIYCNDDAQLVFGVQLNQDAVASLSATFYNGSQQCAVAFADPRLISANSAATFTLDYLLFVDIVDNFLCPLPQRTTRMVVELWQQGRSVPLLTRDFEHRYSFVRQ